MEVFSWVSPVSAAVAAVFAALAYWTSRSASKAAERSARAAEASAAADTKLAERFVPAWRLERRDTGTLRLWNGNGEAAYQVEISATPWYFTEGSAHHDVIPAGSSVAFLLETDEQVDWDTMLRVTWHRRKDGDDAVQTWQEPIVWRMF